MKPALGYRLIEAPEHWHQIPSGEYLLELQNKIVSERLKMCFGRHLIKLGGLSSGLNSRDSLINHQVCLSPSQSNMTIGLLAELDDLPIQNNSVDLLMMAHTLEFSADPHQQLREAHRALIANGNLILSVFNPLSMLLLGKLWPFKSNKLFWKGRLFTVGRIKDWLHLLGFDVIEEQYCCYSTLLGKDSPLDTGFISRMLSRFMPKLGSVCVITAKKREWPLTPIRPRIRYKAVFNPAVRSAGVSKVGIEK
mgnify:CR=1 FL=1